MWKHILPFAFVIIQVSLAEVLKFNGYHVYRVKPQNDNEVEALRKLQGNENYSFWGDFKNGRSAIDIMVAPNEVGNFTKSFSNAKVFIPDVQKLIDQERSKTMTRAANRTMSWEDYYTYDEINRWLTDLSTEFPGKVKLVNVGKSFEGRDILGVHVSFNPENANKSIWLEGGMHAREWIGVASVTYQLNEILRSTDPDIRAMAESHDWYVFPIYNPDGYVYTFTNNRMWRKTRQRHNICIGADPNRNWDFKWHEGDYNYLNPCSETYAGPRAFSEPETKQLSAYIRSIAQNLVGYISHHAYSQLLLIPYGDSPAHKENFDELYAVGLKMAESIKQVEGTEFEVGNIVEVLYKATGNDVDWVKHTFKTRMTYIYELRDKGNYGFLLPANQIIPSGKEVLAGLKTMCNEFKKIDETS